MPKDQTRVRYGFKEQLMDFLSRGPKAVLAALLVTVFVFLLVAGGLLIPELGVAVLVAFFIVGVWWACIYIADHWGW